MYLKNLKNFKYFKKEILNGIHVRKNIQLISFLFTLALFFVINFVMGMFEDNAIQQSAGFFVLVVVIAIVGTIFSYIGIRTKKKRQKYKF
jgi:uncharacterized membrane protein YhaH (DUF805 family)